MYLHIKITAYWILEFILNLNIKNEYMINFGSMIALQTIVKNTNVDMI